MSDSTFITRVVLKHYKSIAACDVRLRPLTFLSRTERRRQKQFSRCSAIRRRCVALIVRPCHTRSRGHQRCPPPLWWTSKPFQHSPRFHSCRIVFTGHYVFRIAARPPGGYEVQREECLDLLSRHSLTIHEGIFPC